MVDLMKSTWTLGNPSSGTGPFFAPSVTHLFIQTPNSATLLLTQMNQQLFDDLRDLQRQPKQLSGATYSQGGDVRMKTSQAYLPVPSSTYLNSSFQCRLTINDIQELVYTYYSYFVTFLFNMLYLGTTPVYLVPFAQTDFCI